MRRKPTFCRYLCPISPPTNRAVSETDEGWESINDASILPASDVGGRPQEIDIIDAEDDDTVQIAEPLPSPIAPTKAQRDAHNVTHLPYRSWCPHCVAARRPNSAHRIQKSGPRSMPLLVADYCFLKDSEDDVGIPVFVARLYPAKAMLATVCDQKGEDDNVIARVAQFIKDSGYSKIVYRSDQEHSVRLVFEHAFRKSQRQGLLYNPNLEQLVPEASAVGESQSNGKAENAVQRLEDLVRTYKSALESHTRIRIPARHPITRWMVEHAASIHNRYVLNEDGSTPYEVLHGQRYRGKVAEFGEQCFYFVPKKLRSKLNLRFRVGTFLGNSQSSNEAFVADSKGEVIKTRAVVRVVEASRWSSTAVLGVIGIPSNLRPGQSIDGDEYIEEMIDPHENADKPVGPHDLPDSKLPSLPKQQRITVRDLEKYGFSERCPRCSDLQAGDANSKKHHSDECRLRLYMHWKDDNHWKWKTVSHLFGEEERKFSPSQVDLEQAPSSPVADQDWLDNLPDDAFDNPLYDPPPAPSTPAPETPSPLPEGQDLPDLMQDDSEDEMEVAQIFGDFDQEMDGSDEMVSALVTAGVSETEARDAAMPMFATTVPASFAELYGKTITDYASQKRRSLNVKGLDSFDMRTLKPNGEPWNFCRKSDRQEAKKIIKRKKPTWVIGAPPCTPFSIWNHGINHKKMAAEDVKKSLEEGRLHLKFACSLYRYQVSQGRYFLHEHPASAMSWREDSIESVLKLRNVRQVTGHQCQYGLVTPSVSDPNVLVPAMKPTRFMSNSDVMLQQLMRKCDHEHIHQPLVGGRCKAAAMYPEGLVKAILRGISLQATQDEQFKKWQQSSKVCAMPMSSPHGPRQDPRSDEVRKHKVEKLNGGFVPIEFRPENYKTKYVDEYTGEILPHDLVRAAMEDELMYFNDKVWKTCSKSEMEETDDFVFVRCRWVLCNKGDSANPDVRARLVATEINKDGRNDFFSASTPPLEGKKLIFAKFVSERHRKGKPLRLSFVDIRKAYFNGIPQRSIFMKIPPEMGLGSDVVAKQVRCVYGTRDAGKIWEDTYTQVLLAMGFEVGASNPCVFWHPGKDISIVVHGDDFTALGDDQSLDWYEGELKKSFEIKVRGRLGEGCPGAQQIKILNRIVTLDSEGLTYEADPRHTDLLMSSLSLTESSSASSPGVKPTDRDDTAQKRDESMDLNHLSPSDAIASICCTSESPEQ